MAVELHNMHRVESLAPGTRPPSPLLVRLRLGAAGDIAPLSCVWAILGER
jgi:hypothetical protein